MRSTVRPALVAVLLAAVAAVAAPAAQAATAPTAAELAQQPHSIPVLAVTDLGALTTLGRLGYDFAGLLGQ